MVDVGAFRTELEADIEARVARPVVEQMKVALEAAYSFIIADWPKHTGYSAANNFVSIGAPVETPKPSERPTHKGAMFDDVAITFGEGVRVIRSLRPPRTGERRVFISNPVSYASDVGFEQGRGDAIYERAANIAETQSTLQPDVF